MEGLLNGASSAAATFSSVHGNGGGSVIHAADLKLAKCVRNIAELAAAATPAESLPKLPEAALVTGANGFLGRFLVLDLLRCAVVLHRIICPSQCRVSTAATRLPTLPNTPFDLHAFVPSNSVGHEAWHCCCPCRRGVHVTAIVRSTSDVAARVRLRDAFGDPELLAKFDELARSRLTVLAGTQQGASLPLV